MATTRYFQLHVRGDRLQHQVAVIPNLSREGLCHSFKGGLYEVLFLVTFADNLMGEASV